MGLREDWDSYFLIIAAAVSTRSTCPRARVGCVLVRGRQIISTGYNGSPSGEPNCEDKQCIIENDRCIRAVHSEVNAIGQAAKMGISTDQATAYIHDDVKSSRNIGPCGSCVKALKAAGIIKVITSMPSPEDGKPQTVTILLSPKASFA